MRKDRYVLGPQSAKWIVGKDDHDNTFSLTEALRCAKRDKHFKPVIYKLVPVKVSK